MEAMVRCLAIDLGDKRVGLAVGSSETGLVRPLETVLRDARDKALFERIRDLIKSEQVDLLVLGEPLNMDGSVGPRAVLSHAFARRLKGAFKQVEVTLMDERLSSFSADAWMERNGISKTNRAKWRDAYAAGVILLDYFEGEGGPSLSESKGSQ